jgi:hypothetical protein
MRITFDNYPEETSWEIRDSSNQFATSGNNYGANAPGSTINISKTLSDGCYTMIVRDAYGDGICCTYGNGSYTLTNSTNNTVLASGGTFGATQSTSFCLTNGKLTSLEDQQVIQDQIKTTVRLFPNPAQTYLSISSQSPATDFTVFNTLGQVVFQGKLIDNNINVSELNSGVYFLRLNVENESIIKQFIKQ